MISCKRDVMRSGTTKKKERKRPPSPPPPLPSYMHPLGSQATIRESSDEFTHSLDSWAANSLVHPSSYIYIYIYYGYTK